jgi:hypothetical protein
LVPQYISGFPRNDWIHETFMNLGL